MSDSDHYEAYYAQKLWGLLPSVYRGADATDDAGSGPLRELVGRIGAQAAVVRRSIDRLWDDQSIETCDDWLIPYLGDLLAANLVAGLDARAQRLSVAKTVYYRRRKGTLGIVQEVARDTTGWGVRTVEFFRRLGRARHGLDPALGWPLERVAHGQSGAARPSLAVVQGLLGPNTGTPAGGFADLRRAHGASRAAEGPFDEASHTLDVRRGAGRVGWHGIHRLGVFVWRLKVTLSFGVDPVADLSCPARFTFDPTGRQVSLFAVPPPGGGGISPEEHELPGPISRGLLAIAFEKLYARPNPAQPSLLTDCSIAVFDGPIPADDPAHALLQASDFSPKLRDPGRHRIDPETGFVYFSNDQPRPKLPLVAYATGLLADIGAGAYERAAEALVPPAAAPEQTLEGGASPAALPTSGTLVIKDSRTYAGLPDVTVTVGQTLVVRAEAKTRALLRFIPSGQLAATWTITGSPANEERSSLWLDGVFLSGATLVLAGEFETVTIASSTLDPGEHDGAQFQLAIDGRALVASRIQVTGHVRRLVISRSLVGPIETADQGVIDQLELEDCVVQGVGGVPALTVETGLVVLRRTTILGTGRAHRLEASESILHDQFDVADYQHGCLRFSAWATGSRLPRKYESVQIAPRAGLFASTRFGDAEYAQLLDATDSALAEGSENGSEMGAFCAEKTSIKLRALRIKLREFMPAGLAPIVVPIT